MAQLVIHLVAAASAAAGLGLHPGQSQDSTCRCVPTDTACWPAVSEWDALNRSVSGRLFTVVDPFEPCREDVGSSVCNATLFGDNASWLSNQPGALQSTGQLGRDGWSAADARSEYAVHAVTEQDCASAVAFAHRHNLRLVVKNTGHDWYGRSTAAGSLMLWTHQMKGITWHDDGYVSPGCVDGSRGDGVNEKVAAAVTVEAGVQFLDLYPEAQRRGKLVIGGTCDTVGVAGCWLAGCYGNFAKSESLPVSCSLP